MPKYLSKTKYAKKLGIARSTLYQWIAKGKLPKNAKVKKWMGYEVIELK